MHAPSPAPGRLAPCTAPVVTPWFHPPQGVWNHDNIRSTTVVLEGVPSGEEDAGKRSGIGGRHPHRRAEGEHGWCDRVCSIGAPYQRHNMVPRMPVGHIGSNRCHHTCHVKTRYTWWLLLAYSDYGALVLQTFHAMPHDVYLLHTVPRYPGNAVIDTHAGRFPNG